MKRVGTGKVIRIVVRDEPVRQRRDVGVRGWATRLHPTNPLALRLLSWWKREREGVA